MRHVPDVPKPRSPYAVEVGERLARARAAAGYSQAAFARRLEIAPQKMANYEKGLSMVPPALAAKIYLLTRINSDWLYLDDPSRLPADLYGKLFPPAQRL